MARRRHQTAAASVPAAPAVVATTAAIPTGVSSPRRLRSETGRLNVRIGQSFSVAMARNVLSGLTANGCPTASSMGASVSESEYAKLVDRS